MVAGVERGSRDGGWSTRGWVFLRQGEIQGVWEAVEVRDLPLRLVPEDVGRAVGRLG